MGAKTKHSTEQIAKAVERFAKGEQVTALAKEFKVSVPGMYLWIKKAKQAAADAAKTANMNPESIKLDHSINTALTVKALYAENERLKRKLLELMIKYKEIEL